MMMLASFKFADKTSRQACYKKVNNMQTSEMATYVGRVASTNRKNGFTEKKLFVVVQRVEYAKS